jgi:hypothetical protein
MSPARRCIRAAGLLGVKPRKANAIAARGGGEHGAIDRLEKQGQQSKHSPSDAARELRTAENQFAFQR